jgi:hypothetical protein
MIVSMLGGSNMQSRAPVAVGSLFEICLQQLVMALAASTDPLAAANALASKQRHTWISPVGLSYGPSSLLTNGTHNSSNGTNSNGTRNARSSSNGSASPLVTSRNGTRGGGSPAFGSSNKSSQASVPELMRVLSPPQSPSARHSLVSIASLGGLVATSSPPGSPLFTSLSSYSSPLHSSRSIPGKLRSNSESKRTRRVSPATSTIIEDPSSSEFLLPEVRQRRSPAYM